MAIHTEINLEDEICESLAALGWKYSPKDAADYDRSLALFPADVLAWVQETQPDAWSVLTKNHGDGAGSTLLSRLRHSLDQSGTLHVLRNGFDVLGVRSQVKMAQFKPALAMNPAITQRYAANRLRVVRQVRYSVHNQLNIDLVLFLNGIPVATAELKTDFTQSIHDAIDQYRFDRIPNPKRQDPDPLLSFPSGALVHFAVSSSEVRMTTKLAGPATRFLPFDQGSNGPGRTGAAGNPLNADGHQTAYLWEQVWHPERWLDILGRYLFTELDDKKQIKTIIFPRFHQLDVTRKLSAAVLAEGVGEKYLIQHSAGSVRELAATEGKQFAVIADEAHSSQTGASAAKLKQVLSVEEQAELADGGEVGTEDILAAQMAAKASDAGVTYVAFTATPKSKTLETFGRLPDPSKPKSKANLPAPWHVYSMQQAIEEDFILDVLQNYTTYTLAFKLANRGQDSNTKEQFNASPDIRPQLVNAIIDAFDAHTEMSTQALNNESVLSALQEIITGPARLYDKLNQQQAG